MQHAVGAPAVDWLTLTTFHEGTYDRLRFQLEDITKLEVKKKTKRMQYEGVRTEHTFHGKGNQTGEVHFMVQVSGMQANELYERIYALEGSWHLRCTRIDIQYTRLRYDTDEGLATSAKYIRSILSAGIGGKGRQPEVTGYDKGGKIGETVYIGSRLSEVFVRIYDKEIGGMDHIRFEVEYKGHTAQNIFFSAIHDKKILGAMLLSEVGRFAGASNMTGSFFDELKMHERLRRRTIKDLTTDERTLQWLEDVVGRVIRRLAYSRYSSEVKRILKEWLDIIGDDV